MHNVNNEVLPAALAGQYNEWQSISVGRLAYCVGEFKLMGYRDRTDIGGEREVFLTTHWSLIEGIQKQQDPGQALIGLLLRRYWKPVYCYLHRTGYDNEQAKDLTQGFFHEVVLSRHLI